MEIKIFYGIMLGIALILLIRSMAISNRAIKNDSISAEIGHLVIIRTPGKPDSVLAQFDHSTEVLRQGQHVHFVVEIRDMN